MKKGNVIIVWITMVVAAIVLFLTHDIIITHILAWQICRNDPHPKSFIKETVEYPESIYWEDNIYPGFDGKEDRFRMIRNYLDGVHLKTMALNGQGNKIYLYSSSLEDWQGSNKIKNRNREFTNEYFDQLDNDARIIARREQIFTQESMPQLKYKVSFNQVALTAFQSRYLQCDEVRITEISTGKLIAYNRRLRRRYYIIMPNIWNGNEKYFPDTICGDPSHLIFEKVLVKNNRQFAFSMH